ncbi:hypothetical protein Csa_002159 [Cucumis sativus]|uniref:Uncharacterized protein n=1 Tax=Cucumis sativus TaxID=3659 RepID=A0A0A0LH37_CUCSA|nr:hypothetical protein Csa_002159 [Cucumis sativus]
MAKFSFILIFILAFISVTVAAAIGDMSKGKDVATKFHYHDEFIWGRKERINHGSFRGPDKYLLNDPHPFHPFDQFQGPIL